MKLAWFPRKETRTPAEIDEQLSLDYRLTFATESGLRVLADLTKVCHMFEPSYVSGMDGETNFREGERNALLYILSRAKLPAEREKIIEEELEYGG